MQKEFIIEKIDKTPLASGKYVIFDIETTGGNPTKNGITEIFAIKFHKNQIIDTFYSMVNPEIPVPPIVRRMTGITNNMLKNKPTIDKVMPQFISFISGSILVSHNFLGDFTFLDFFAFQTKKVNIKNFFLCTHLLSEKIFPEAPHKSLKGLGEHLNLFSKNLHRAKGDAYITLDLFKILIKKLSEKSINTIGDAIRFQGDYKSSIALGWRIKEKKIGYLPNYPGIFYLMSQNNKTIFLSSALNIKKEINYLKKFSKISKPLLRIIVNAKDIKYKYFDNAFLAAYNELFEHKRYSIPYHPAKWHQRYIQCIYIADFKNDILVGTGSLIKGTIKAYGPIENRKLAKNIIFDLSNILGGHPLSKGTKFKKSYLSLIEAYFKNDLLNETYKLQKKYNSILIRFFSKKRKSLKSHINIIEKLRDLPPFPINCKPLLNKDGILAIGTKSNVNKYLIYTVTNSMAQKENITTKNINEYLSSHKNQKHIFSLISKQKKAHLKKYKLSSSNAALTNMTLWWVYYGMKFCNIKYIDIKDFPKKRSFLQIFLKSKYNRKNKKNNHNDRFKNPGNQL